MADIQQQIQQARQQAQADRERLNRERQRALSTQTLRQQVGRQGVFQRQQQLQKIGAAEAQVVAREQEIASVESQVQAQQAAERGAQDRSQQIQQAIRDGLRGKVGSSDAYRGLSRQERIFVKDQIDELEESAEKIGASRAELLAKGIIKPRTADERVLLSQITSTPGGFSGQEGVIMQSVDARTLAPQNRPVSLNTTVSLSSDGRNGPQLDTIYSAGNSTSNLVSGPVSQNLSQIRQSSSDPRKTQVRSYFFNDAGQFEPQVGKALDTGASLLFRGINKVTGPGERFLREKGIITNDLAFTPTGPVNLLFAKQSTATVGRELFFAPAFATGSFSEAAESAFVPKRTRLKVNQVTGEVEVSTTTTDDIIARIQERAVLNPNSVREDFRSLIAKNINNKEGLDQTRKIMERALGDRGKELYDDLLRQERAVLPESEPRVRVKTEILGNLPQQRGASVLTGQAGSPRSAFEGTGQYERTDFQVAQRPSSSQNVLQLGLQNQNVSQRPIQILGLRPRQDTSQPQRQKQNQEQRQRVVLSLGLVQAQETLQRQRTQQNQALDPRFRQPQPRPRQQPRPRSPFFPSIKQEGLTFAARRAALSRAAFDVFIRKAGKPVKIASGLPFGRATRAGVARNIGDISASFELREAGTTTRGDIPFRVPSNVFYRGRGAPVRFVQRRGFRLDTAREVSDILSAKRRGQRIGQRRRSLL